MAFLNKTVTFADMNELSRHIEILLLENDCVIIPGFGGFITHHSNSHSVEEEGLFLPPTRTVGFNPQLIINDGLLVQSYMKAYDTDFADASKIVDKAVEELRQSLDENGEFEIHGVGRITVGIDHDFEFHPNEDGILTPGLYGLSSFMMNTLDVETQNKTINASAGPRSEKVYEIKINRRFLRYTAAAAAAIIAFFFLSVPAENTYVEEENFAMLDAGGIFENIRGHSLATSIFPMNQVSESTRQPKQNQVRKQAHPVPGKPLKPVSVRTEKVFPREVNKVSSDMSAKVSGKPVSPSVESKANPKEFTTETPKYNVIVASVGSRKDAESMVAAWKAKGYSAATVIEGNGKIRVSLLSFFDQADAYKKISRLKEDGTFKDAWVLTTK